VNYWKTQNYNSGKNNIRCYQINEQPEFISRALVNDVAAAVAISVATAISVALGFAVVAVVWLPHLPVVSGSVDEFICQNRIKRLT